MNDNVFRKKSLERISSPEQLNDYIKVSNPTVWLIISAICVLLLAFSIWGIRGNITTTVNSTGTFLDNKIAVCCVNAEDAQKISRAMATGKDELDVTITDKYDATGFKTSGKVKTMYSQSYKKSVITKNFGLQAHIADAMMPSTDGNYFIVLVEIDEDVAQNDVSLISLGIITEEVSPYTFITGKE